ncbi:MAG: lysoplasmalogenase [Actinomycetota bacterium]
MAAALVCAALDWGAVEAGNKRREYVLKPLTTGLLVVAAVVLREAVEPSRWGPTVAALVLSLLGDVFLMLRRERFAAGLWCFLFAHLAYVLAFDTLRADVPTAVAGAVVLLAGSVLYGRLRRGMLAREQGEFAVPVAVYNLAIGAMLVSALVTPFRPEWDGLHTAFAIVGAVLFMLSDSLIGWTRFVRSFPRSEVAIMVTYHLAQVLLLLALLG